MREVMLLSGVLGRDDVSEEFREELPDPAITAPKREIWCKFTVYSVDDDEVRDFNIKGVFGDITVHEPALEERQRVNAVRIADLLVENDIDMHDFKEILWRAGWALNSGNPLLTAVLREKVTNAYEQLGGME